VQTSLTSLKAVGELNQTAPRSSVRLQEPLDRLIHVRQIVQGASIEDLNRSAEEYFASLTDWEHHLAKPFSNSDETPTLLINLGILLQGLRLTPDATVLEFGAGTG
jgi:hypothetical protein